MNASRMSTDLRWTHLTADTTPQWAELTNLLAKVDGTEEFYEPEDLVEELEESGFDPATDSFAVWAGDTMVGYGQLRVAANLDHEGRVRCNPGGGVHPEWRGQGIGRELVARQEARALEIAAQRHPGAEPFFRTDGELEGSAARRLLTHLGYAVVRHFNSLTRPIPGEPVVVPRVEGVTLRCPTDADERAVHRTHNAAFADHWGSAPMSEDGWHDYWSARAQRRQVSTIAVDDRGEVLAYVLAGQWTPRELYVAAVGTAPAARGRGLAAACLTRTIALASESGDYDKVDLDVDSESPTGATRLYERVGFTLARTTAAMQKDATQAS